jgi:hypothetical protein
LAAHYNDIDEGGRREQRFDAKPMLLAMGEDCKKNSAEP